MNREPFSLVRRVWGGVWAPARRLSAHQFTWLALSLALAVVITLPSTGASAQTSEPGGTTVHDIVSAPESYYGQKVMLTGAVEQGLGQRSFTLEDDDLLYNDTLLVVSMRPALSDTGEPLDMQEVVAMNVLVTGTVQPFELSAVEREIGSDLTDEQFADWEGKPTIVARSVVEWSPGFGPMASHPVGSQEVVEATVDQITDQPTAFYADIVSVTGDLARAIGERSFVLKDNDLLFNEELLVVSTRPLVNDDGQPLRITTFAGQGVDARVKGHVRQFDLAEIERELAVDLDDALFSDWGGRPVLVATSVRLPRVSPFPGRSGS